MISPPQPARSRRAQIALPAPLRDAADALTPLVGIGAGGRSR